MKTTRESFLQRKSACFLRLCVENEMTREKIKFYWCNNFKGKKKGVGVKDGTVQQTKKRARKEKRRTTKARTNEKGRKGKEEHATKQTNTPRRLFRDSDSFVKGGNNDDDLVNVKN